MSIRLVRWSGWLACLTLVVFSGCDAIKSIGQEEEEPAEVAESSEPSLPPEVGSPIGEQAANNNAPPVNDPEPAPMPTSEEILAAFQAKPSNERTDDDLKQLAQTPALLAGITELDLTGGAISNAALPYLAVFPDLERLNLSHTRVTNDGLSQLTACPKLTAIALDGLRLVDETGFRELTSMPLREVSLQSTSVTEPVFVVLSEFEDLQVLHLDGNANLTGIQFRGLTDKFENLRELSASGTQIGFGLQQIGQLNDLEILRVGNADVTDGVLEQLAQCRKLVELNLSDNPITIIGIPFLSRLNDLQNLNLRACNGVTDEALSHLGRLEGLQRLDLTGTQCTMEGAQTLKERLENCVIVFDDMEI